MKLFVDDIRDPKDDSWTVARKVEQAIRLISQFKFDEISLDHDIENRPDDETFKPIAYFIGEKYFTNKPAEGFFDMVEKTREEAGLPQLYIGRPSWYPKITIHSVNPVGAKEIAAILNDYGISSTIAPYESEEAFRTKYGL